MSARSRTTLVADVMTTRVQTATSSQSLQEIWALLSREKCHHVPIVENDRVVGIISSRDLVRIARQRGVSKLSPSALGETTAMDAMTHDVETIDRDAPVELAIDRIGRGDLHALVVVDEDDALAGIVTDRDLLHFLVS